MLDGKFKDKPEQSLDPQRKLAYNCCPFRG